MGNATRGGLITAAEPAQELFVLGPGGEELLAQIPKGVEPLSHILLKLLDLRPDVGQRLLGLLPFLGASGQCLLGAGIRPAAVLGHSIGEVAAAHIAGALSLVDAVAVVAVRSRCQHVTQGRGTMAAVLCSEEAAQDFLQRNGLGDLTVAAVNASNSVTISGPKEQIAALRSLGRRQKLAVQPLDIDYDAKGRRVHHRTGEAHASDLD